MKKNILSPLRIVSAVLMHGSFLLGIKTKTRKPISDVPVKSKRYGAYIQIRVSNIKGTVIDGQLGLLKNNALIGIEIEGEIISKSEEAVFLDEITLIEQVSHQQESDFRHIIKIHIVPSFTYKRNRKDKTQYTINLSSVQFKTNIVHRLYTCGFGKNLVEITMEEQKECLILHQGK